MYTLFSRNSLSAYLLLPVAVVLFNLRRILMPVAVEPMAISPVWQSFFAWVPLGGVLSIVINLVMLVIMTLIMSAMANNFGFNRRPNSLGGMFFAIICGGMVFVRDVQLAHLFAFFAVIGIYRLFRASEANNPMLGCFEGAFAYTLGMLIWPKGAWMLAFFWLMLIILRLFTPRCIVASLLGIFVPTLFAATYYVWHDTLPEAVEVYLSQMTTAAGVHTMRLWPKVFSVVLIVLTIVSGFSAIRNMSTLKITESLFCSVALWLTFCTLAMAFFPFFFVEMQMLIAVGASLLLTSYVGKMQSRLWAEIVTSVTAAIAFVVQWYI